MKLKSLAITALFAVALTGCGGETEPVPAAEPEALAPLPEGDGTRENPYVGRGLIEEIGETELLIQHETIPGLMPSMTMAFRVIDEIDLTGLSVGDQIRFDVEMADGGSYQVIRIEPVGGE